MLNKLWVEAWSHLFVELSRQELGWLVSPRQHISLLAARRAAMILSRIRVIASLFATLTPLWIIVDLLLLPNNVWPGLALARLLATAGFAYVVLRFKNASRVSDAYQALGWIIAILVLFFLGTYLDLSQFNLSGTSAVLSAGYGFLPVVLVAGLAIFPLTAKEGSLCLAVILGVHILAATLHGNQGDLIQAMLDFWLLVLIGAVALFAGMSQLAFMIALVREAIRDPLTGVFSRLSGEELMELQFIISSRAATPLSVVFLDLDRFKQVNDQYGHDAGDQVLIVATERIRKGLRTGDMLARWGGEEFVIIMPNTLVTQAVAALGRITAAGLGIRPDGQNVTASMGVAERLEEGVPDWQALVEKADTRMYLAKSAGRDRVVFQDR